MRRRQPRVGILRTAYTISTSASRLEDFRHNLANDELWRRVISSLDVGDEDARDIRDAITAVQIALKNTVVPS